MFIYGKSIMTCMTYVTYTTYLVSSLAFLASGVNESGLSDDISLSSIHTAYFDGFILDPISIAYSRVNAAPKYNIIAE